MKTKEITIKAQVFDDPEYCTSNINNGNPSECRFYFGDCMLFDKQLVEKNINTTGTITRIKKCDACKKAFNGE